MTTSCEVRRAGPADLDALVELAWAVASEGRWLGAEVPFDRSARRERYADLAATDDGSSVLLVADLDGVPVGELAVRVAPYGVADVSMMVARAQRGVGIGRTLLDAGLAWARTTDAHKAWLEVWPHNEAAIALYRRAGFVEEGRKIRHYRRRSGDLWDAILMGLPLRTP